MVQTSVLLFLSEKPASFKTHHLCLPSSVVPVSLSILSGNSGLLAVFLDKPWAFQPLRFVS